MTPLHRAVQLNDVKIVQLLLNHPKINTKLRDLVFGHFFKCDSSYVFFTVFRLNL